MKALNLSDSDFVYPDCETDDREILRVQSDRSYFENFPGLYFRKTERRKRGTNGQEKKNNRVFKSKHSCLICGKLVAKPVQHLTQVHTQEEAVKN